MMKKSFTTFVFLVVLGISPLAMAKNCNIFDASTRSTTQTLLPEAGNESNNTNDVLDRLNADGSLPSGISGNFNHLEGMEMTYATNGSPRFARRVAGWSAVGAGVSFMVHAIAISGNDVYVGGGFTTAGGITANYIAKWNGNSWSALGSGMNNYVYAITISGSDVYVGGDFTTAGGTSANRIAKWNGSSWSAFGSGMNDAVRAIAVAGNNVYAGGDFTAAGGMIVNSIAKWNGSSWSALGTGVLAEPFATIVKGRGSTVETIAVSGSDVYVGGFFTKAGGISASQVAKWNGSSWSTLGSGIDYRDDVYAIAVAGSNVYVGGFFTKAGGISANHIAKWNGSSWSALGTGVNSNLYAITVLGNNVYVGGDFTTAGSASANRIAKWNGSSWSALGAGVNAEVLDIAIGHNGLYAGGVFTTAGSSMQSGNIEFENESSAQQVVAVANRIAYYTDATFTTSVVSINDTATLADKFSISEAYPNPFNPSTNFTLSIANDQRVEVALFNLMGRKLQTLHNGILTANNTHLFKVNGSGLTSGKYFVRVQGENFTASKGITLIK